MDTTALVNELKGTKDFLDRGTRCLTEEDEAFVPAEGMMSSAQQIAHIAQTVDWFVEGAFGEGFDMNFEEHIAMVMKVTTLSDARAWCDKAFAALIEAIESRSMEEMMQPMQEGPIMGGAPKLAIVSGVVDHTAHHRGALAVYARLRGKVPAMPYME